MSSSSFPAITPPAPLSQGGLGLNLGVRTVQAMARSAPERRKKVLVIDDNRDVRVGLNLRLQASGYDTAFAADGASAITIARRETPDAILLDLGLPGGDGFLVLERLRALPRLAIVPVIVVTAREPTENEARARQLGAFAFFQKPVEDATLMGTLALALNPHWRLDAPLPS